MSMVLLAPESFEKSVCDWKSVPKHNDRCNLQRNIIIANLIPIYVVSWCNLVQNLFLRIIFLSSVDESYVNIVNPFIHHFSWMWGKIGFREEWHPLYICAGVDQFETSNNIIGWNMVSSPYISREIHWIAWPIGHSNHITITVNWKTRIKVQKFQWKISNF